MSGSAPAALALAVSTLALIGCGDSQAGEDASRGEGLCARETRDDTFAVGLAKTGTMGLFEVSFIEADPAPPDRGLNRWLLEVKTSTGALVDGAELRVRPWMPDHGHGSNPPYLFPTPTGQPGRHELSELDLFMSGFWQFTVRVTRGVVSDELEFGFCIEG